MSTLEVLRSYSTGALGCPHPDARERHTMYVRSPEGGQPMALCGPCDRMFGGLCRPGVQRAQVVTEMAAAGYPPEDARDLWRQLRRDARRRWLRDLCQRISPRRQEVCG